MDANDFLRGRFVQVVDILDDTIVDGPGFRTSIYFAGCKHACASCHNKHTWNFHAGKTIALQDLYDHCMRQHFSDVTFTGGDPMYTAAAIWPLAKSLHDGGKNIWCYTGFTIEQIFEDKDMLRLAQQCDVIVDGMFDKSLADDSLLFRGSSNQRIIDMHRTTHDYIATLSTDDMLR